MSDAKILELCKTEFSSLKGRFGRDDERILEALVEMCKQGVEEPQSEIPDIPESIEILINRWKGDSRGGGLELSMVNVWQRGQKLASNN